MLWNICRSLLIMRELKFKIYDKNDTKAIIGTFAWNKLPQFLFPENFIVLQYTGMKDRNGVEVYEGDIIQMIYDTGERGKIEEIEWLDGINFDYAGWGTKTVLTSQWKYSEIIGNIFETPELLK